MIITETLFTFVDIIVAILVGYAACYIRERFKEFEREYYENGK